MTKYRIASRPLPKLAHFRCRNRRRCSARFLSYLGNAVDNNTDKSVIVPSAKTYVSLEANSSMGWVSQTAGRARIDLLPPIAILQFYGQSKKKCTGRQLVLSSHASWSFVVVSQLTR